MIYIAKMSTRYPDFHGAGYYNFLMSDSRDELTAQIEENSHDFYLVFERTTRFASVENIIAKYPSKADLNEKYFKGL